MRLLQRLRLLSRRFGSSSNRHGMTPLPNSVQMNLPKVVREGLTGSSSVTVDNLVDEILRAHSLEGLQNSLRRLLVLQALNRRSLSRLQRHKDGSPRSSSTGTHSLNL